MLIYVAHSLSIRFLACDADSFACRSMCQSPVTLCWRAAKHQAPQRTKSVTHVPIYYFSEPPNFPKPAGTIFKYLRKLYSSCPNLRHFCSGSAEMVKNKSKTDGFLEIWMYASRTILRFTVFCQISMILNCRKNGYGKTCM